jgi:hypothetical protein
MTTKYNIDDSHGISHSFDILHHTNNIFIEECKLNQNLKEQENIVLISSLLHDMCDKKYMNETDGIEEIKNFLKDTYCISDKEIDVIKTIIETMSYSKVAKNGFPQLNEYQTAYHIVREADLLCAYDVDRCMIYHLYKHNTDLEKAFLTAEQMFENRIFKHQEHGLILLTYTKNIIPMLENQAIMKLHSWKSILKIK